MEGTATDSAIAFRMTRYSDEDPAGLTASGPSLRTCDLDVDRFRTFVCDRIATLVQAALNRRQ